MAVYQEPLISEEEASNAAGKSPFERQSFREYMKKFNGEMPSGIETFELVKVREEAIKYREDHEKRIIDKMLRKEQITPRTHSAKRKEIEVWVSKQQEEIKKTKKVFQKEIDKIKYMLQETDKKNETMKNLLGTGRLSS